MGRKANGENRDIEKEKGIGKVERVNTQRAPMGDRVGRAPAGSAEMSGRITAAGSVEDHGINGAKENGTRQNVRMVDSVAKYRGMSSVWRRRLRLKGVQFGENAKRAEDRRRQDRNIIGLGWYKGVAVFYHSDCF